MKILHQFNCGWKNPFLKLSIKEASKIISAKFENSLGLICLRFLLILFSSRFWMIKAPQLGVQKRPNEQERELIFLGFFNFLRNITETYKAHWSLVFFISTFTKWANWFEIRVLIKQILYEACPAEAELWL